MDARVRFEAFEAGVHQVFVDCSLQFGWTLLEAIKVLQKPHYHQNAVVVEFLVAGRHLDVHFLDDVGVQKRGLAVELPALQVVLRRD